MILHISTKDQKVITVALKDKWKVVKSLSEENKYGSQVLLPLITKLLGSPGEALAKRGRKKMTFKDLDGIEVETGPGSFTGLRVGVSVANALGYSLGIPVNGKKLETDLVY